jgi:hypothetical protein
MRCARSLVRLQPVNGSSTSVGRARATFTISARWSGSIRRGRPPPPRGSRQAKALRVEDVDELGHMGGASLEHQGDLRHALALKRGEQEHRPVLHDGVLTAPREPEEVCRLPHRSARGQTARPGGPSPPPALGRPL